MAPLGVMLIPEDPVVGPVVTEGCAGLLQRSLSQRAMSQALIWVRVALALASISPQPFLLNSAHFDLIPQFWK